MTLEFAIMAPVFVMFLTLLAYAGRVVDLKSQLDGIARDAARAASTGRSLDEATTLATSTANAELNGKDWCKGQPVTGIDPAGTDWRAGGFVKVNVRCELVAADLSILPLPSYQGRGEGTAPVDTFTRRSP
jgi:hypothetical protein